MRVSAVFDLILSASHVRGSRGRLEHLSTSTPFFTNRLKHISYSSPTVGSCKNGWRAALAEPFGRLHFAGEATEANLDITVQVPSSEQCLHACTLVPGYLNRTVREPWQLASAPPTRS